MSIIQFSHTEIQQYLHDPRLGRSDIASRIVACAMLRGPWDYYRHHDGSFWNGYGWPILDNFPEPIAAEVLQFWETVYRHAEQWLTVDDYFLPHSLDPIAGHPMLQGDEFHQSESSYPKSRYTAATKLPPLPGLGILQARQADYWDFLNALQQRQQSLSDALDSDRKLNLNQDEPIADLLAAGADPEDLVGAGLLRDDIRPIQIPIVQPRLSAWANPDLTYRTPQSPALEPVEL